MKRLAKEEIETLKAELSRLEDELRLSLLPKDPNDEKNILLEIRAGTGGEEAALFAAELFRAYLKYAELNRSAADARTARKKAAMLMGAAQGKETRP